MKKLKQQWLRGWMREKVRAGEIPGWVFECLDREIPGEIPAPDLWVSGRSRVTAIFVDAPGIKTKIRWVKSKPGALPFVKVLKHHDKQREHLLSSVRSSAHLLDSFMRTRGLR